VLLLILSAHAAPQSSRRARQEVPGEFLIGGSVSSDLSGSQPRQLPEDLAPAARN